MPYPAQISPDRIIEQAREMVEAEGAEPLSLHKLAAALGVKAPSLYRYFGSKTELLRALNLRTIEQLSQATEAAKQAADGDHRAQLLNIAQAWRAFAHAYPMSYMLACANPNPELRLDDRLLEALAISIQAVMVGVSGDADSLAALRGLWALLHGFLLLETSDQFQRGGSLDDAFAQSVEAYLDGWSQRAGDHAPTRERARRDVKQP